METCPLCLGKGTIHEDIMKYDVYVLDMSLHRLSIGGLSIFLTTSEAKVIRPLLAAKGRYVPGQKLMEYLWDGKGFYDESRAASVLIHSIRKKALEYLTFDIIENKREVGYRLKTFGQQTLTEL